MKRILCVLFIALIAFSQPIFARSGSPVEIIYSETFEGDLSRWTADGVDGVKNAELFDTEKDYIKNCLLIYDKKDGTNCVLKSEVFDVKPGNVYTIVVDMKSKEEGQTKAQLVFLNKYNGKIENGDFTVGAIGNGEWICASMWVKAPEDAIKAQVYLTYEKSEKSEEFGYFDNVMVCNNMVGFSKNFKTRKETSPRASDDSNTALEKEKILIYDNFENGFKSWNPITATSKNRVYISNIKAYTGLKSLKITSNSDKEETGVESEFLNIIPGTEYTFSFEISSIYGESASVSLCFYDKDKNKLSDENIVSDGLAWKKNTVNLNAPLNALYAKIIIKDKGDKKESYIDNIKLSGEKGTGNILDYKSKYDLVFENSLNLFLGKPYAYNKGKKVLIDKNNSKVIPLIKEQRTLVPVRFIAESLGALVSWDEKENKIEIIFKEKKVTMKPDSKTVLINGEELYCDVAPMVKNGRTYLPLRVLCENVMDKKVFWDDRGLIVISDEDIINNIGKGMADKLTELF